MIIPYINKLHNNENRKSNVNYKDITAYLFLLLT